MFGIDIVRFIFLKKITTTARENRMDNQERTIHADTLASFETLFIKFDLYRISFYSGFGLDKELYNQFNNQTDVAGLNVNNLININKTNNRL
jgi:hypothetical protein